MRKIKHKIKYNFGEQIKSTRQKQAENLNAYILVAVYLMEKKVVVNVTWCSPFSKKQMVSLAAIAENTYASWRPMRQWFLKSAGNGVWNINKVLFSALKHTYIFIVGFYEISIHRLRSLLLVYQVLRWQCNVSLKWENIIWILKCVRAASARRKFGS